MGEINTTASEKKRGMLFTLSVMLLSISLLTFASALSQQSAKSKATAAVLAEVDRAGGAYENVEHALEQVISPSINISVRNSTVYINESLPLSSQIATDLDRFAQFQSLYADQNITMSLADLKGGYFVIRPGEVIVTNAPGEFFITPQNSPESSGTLDSYHVEMVYPVGQVDAAQWASVSNGSASRMSVSVRVRDANYVVLLDFEQQLDRHGTSVLNVSNGGSQVALVQFSSPAALYVQAAGNIGLKTSVGFTNPVGVETNDVLEVRSAANKTGNIRIA